MKINLPNILAFFLLMAVATETLCGIRVKENISAVLLEKEDKSDSKAGGKDNEDCKDKVVRQVPDFYSPRFPLSEYVLSHYFSKYTAYLSLPELPPERA